MLFKPQINTDLRRCNLKSALISVNQRLKNNWEMEQYQIIYRKNFTPGEWVDMSAGCGLGVRGSRSRQLLKYKIEVIIKPRKT